MFIFRLVFKASKLRQNMQIKKMYMIFFDEYFESVSLSTQQTSSIPANGQKCLTHL